MFIIAEANDGLYIQLHNHSSYRHQAHLGLVHGRCTMRYRKAPDNYEDWLKDRKEHPSIGASQAASVLGVNPWQSKVDIWDDIVYGGNPIEDNLAMRLGRDLEPIMRKLFMEQTGLTVTQDNKIRIHEDYDFLTCNLDGMVVGEKVPVEYKTSAQPWDGEIPDHYFVQLQHQMMVTESPYIYYASLSLGFNKQLIIEKYERDDKFISDMKRDLISFWKDHVLTKVPPEPESLEDARKIFYNVDPDSIKVADESLYYICRNLQTLNENKLEIDNNIKDAKLELMKALGNKELLEYNGTTLVTWRKSKDHSYFDRTKFKTENPDLYSKYTNNRNGSRRFILKKMEV